MPISGTMQGPAGRRLGSTPTGRNTHGSDGVDPGGSVWTAAGLQERQGLSVPEQKVLQERPGLSVPEQKVLQERPGLSVPRQIRPQCLPEKREVCGESCPEDRGERERSRNGGRTV